MTYPGFVDLQVNGWRNQDFTDTNLTIDDVRSITSDLVERGTAAYCPTLITAPIESYRRNFRIIAEAMADPAIGKHILGIHLEGPFISPEPGAVGAHPKDHVAPPSRQIFDELMECADGKLRIITVAPEQEGALELIQHAVTRGVTVSLGHHLADDAQMQAAVDAGATLCTHVGNGIPNMIHRHDNPLWWQLSCDDVSGMFITDGHHLPADLITVALRAKSVDKFIVTSDASPLAGMPPGDYKIFGGLAVSINEAGRIYSPQSNSLAGSHATILECMNHLASLELLDEAQLWEVGVENPLRAIDESIDRLAGMDKPAVTYADSAFQ